VKTVYTNPSNGAPLVSERPDIEIITSMDAGGHDQASAPEVPEVTTKRLVVRINYKGDGTTPAYVRLPSLCAVGDEVLLVSKEGFQKFGLVNAFPPTGETLLSATNSDGSESISSLVLKKISLTEWALS
jgi:hypothetical protein